MRKLFPVKSCYLELLITVLSLSTQWNFAQQRTVSNYKKNCQHDFFTIFRNLLDIKIIKMDTWNYILVINQQI